MLGVIPVLANDVTMGLVMTAAKVFLITSSLAGVLLICSEVEIWSPPYEMFSMFVYANKGY
jgi:hypothetical protein